MKVRYGKPIDIAKLKSPVLDDLRGHLAKIKNIVSYMAENEEPLVQDGCYVCGSKECLDFASVHGFQYVQCNECSHVYTKTRYTEEALERFYTKNEYYSKITYANKDTCHYRKAQVAKPKVEYVEDETGLRQGRWIDVGCGIGDMVSVLKDKGWDATGLEISEYSIDYAKEVFGIDLIPQTLADYGKNHPEHVGEIDVISCIGLIEHVPRPLDLLGEVNQLLKLGGYVVIQVPNGGSLSCKVQSSFPENVFRHMCPTDHFMLFTEKSLHIALAKTGFEPISTWMHGLDIYEMLNNMCMEKPELSNSVFVKYMFSKFNEFQQIVDEDHESDRILLIAKKTDA